MFTRACLISVSRVVFILSIGSLITGCSQSASGGGDGLMPDHGLSTTGVSAATGAVLGAGIGTIIGSTTGDAGEGLVLGAVAGAAVGGLVGSEIEEQGELVRQQEEHLRRQGEMLENNRRELEQIKNDARDTAPLSRNNTDTGFSGRPSKKSFGNPSARSKLADSSYSADASLRRLAASRSGGIAREDLHKPGRGMIDGDREWLTLPSTGSFGSRSTAEPTSVAPSPVAHLQSVSKPNPTIARKVKKNSTYKKLEKQPLEVFMENKPKKVERLPQRSPKVKRAMEEELDALVRNELPPAVEEVNKVEPAPKPKIVSPSRPIKSVPAKVASISETNCTNGDEEASRARRASSDADKLFYYRRAIRLCPSVAQYHVEIGRVYASIGRHEDAEYEFRQALDLSPNDIDATAELKVLEQVRSGNGSSEVAVLNQEF